MENNVNEVVTIEKEVVNEEPLSKKELKKQKKLEKKNRKMRLWEKIFVILSSLMVLAVVIIYGYRFVHYYMREHPKDADNSIAAYIKRDTVLLGDGLHTFDEKEYYFTGREVNNYVWYNGRLWQIIDIKDNNIKLISANSETSLVWGIDTVYSESYISKWLESYISSFKEEDLVEYDFCIDSFTLDNVTCKEYIKAKVGLLSINDYFRAGGNNSYLNNNEYYWTMNSNENKAYYVFNNGGINNSVGKEDTYYNYGVRPVIVIKNNYTYYGGDGTKNNPYQLIIDDTTEIGKKNIGDYIKFGDYTWRIQEKNDKSIKLILEGYVSDKTYNYKDAINYLNGDFLKKLDKNKINKCTFNTGSYGKNSKYDYMNITKKTVNAYAGFPSVSELFALDYADVWLYNQYEGGTNLYYEVNDGKTIMGDVSGSKNKLRAVICVNPDTHISTGIGTKENPYVVGEE